MPKKWKLKRTPPPASPTAAPAGADPIDNIADFTAEIEKFMARVTQVDTALKPVLERGEPARLGMYAPEPEFVRVDAALARCLTALEACVGVVRDTHDSVRLARQLYTMGPGTHEGRLGEVTLKLTVPQKPSDESDSAGQ